jgi:hypothetical protein
MRGGPTSKCKPKTWPRMRGGAWVKKEGRELGEGMKRVGHGG